MGTIGQYFLYFYSGMRGWLLPFTDTFSTDHRFAQTLLYFPASRVIAALFC